MMMEDEQIEYSLRPKFLNEYIGQRNVKEHMRIYIEAAKHRSEPLSPDKAGITAELDDIINDVLKDS